MSNACSGCRYKPKVATGPECLPIHNALLGLPRAREAADRRINGRRCSSKKLDRKEAGELRTIRRQADILRGQQRQAFRPDTDAARLGRGRRQQFDRLDRLGRAAGDSPPTSTLRVPSSTAVTGLTSAGGSAGLGTGLACDGWLHRPATSTSRPAAGPPARQRRSVATGAVATGAAPRGWVAAKALGAVGPGNRSWHGDAGTEGGVPHIDRPRRQLGRCLYPPLHRFQPHDPPLHHPLPRGAWPPPRPPRSCTPPPQVENFSTPVTHGRSIDEQRMTERLPRRRNRTRPSICVRCEDGQSLPAVREKTKSAPDRSNCLDLTGFPRPRLEILRYMTAYNLTHLRRLEAESIQIIREVAAEFENPVMLYSIGKDSAVHGARSREGVSPAKPPFPLMHVDTTWKFTRDVRAPRTAIAGNGRLRSCSCTSNARRPGRQASTRSPTAASDAHRHHEDAGACEQALDKHRLRRRLRRRPSRRGEVAGQGAGVLIPLDACTAGIRRTSGPNCWRLYNARKVSKGERPRCPLSNWTELDVWQYIHLREDPDRAALLRGRAARSCGATA